MATTSSTIDPEQMQLNVTQGTVTIGVDGFATDGLPYLDIIAKRLNKNKRLQKKEQEIPKPISLLSQVTVNMI